MENCPLVMLDHLSPNLPPVGKKKKKKWNCLPKKPVLISLENKTNTITKAVEKGEIACNEQFLLYPQCFLPVQRTFCYLHPIQNCRLQTVSIWTSVKFCCLVMG